MSVVARIIALTTELYELLEKPINKEKRDETIASIQMLLDERDSLIQKMTPPFNEDEQELGKKIIDLNRKIHRKLEHLKLQIQGDLILINQKKTVNQSYTDPYQSISFDGTFYDKKS